MAGGRIAFELSGGEIAEVVDISEALSDITVAGNKIYATAKDISGDFTLFVRAKAGEYDAWLPADYEIIREEAVIEPITDNRFEPVDISEEFNCSMTELHNQAYTSPRPEGYSMGMYQNARYSHNWNQKGRNVVYVDDSALRGAGGIVHSPSGIPFIAPAENNNLACVSIFDVFPTDKAFALSGKGRELAVMFVASACCLHTGVENARITVTYEDGSVESESLVYPVSLDDWLTSALTTEAEIFYFSNFNHATVKRVRLNPEKALKSVKVEAIANDLVLGIAGISVNR